MSNKALMVKIAAMVKLVVHDMDDDGNYDIDYGLVTGELNIKRKEKNGWRIDETEYVLKDSIPDIDVIMMPDGKVAMIPSSEVKRLTGYDTGKEHKKALIEQGLIMKNIMHRRHSMILHEARQLVENNMTKSFVADSRSIHGYNYDYSACWIPAEDDMVRSFMLHNAIVENTSNEK